MSNCIYIKSEAFAGHNNIEISLRYDKGQFGRERGYYLRVAAVSIQGSIVAWASDSPTQSYLVEKVSRINKAKFEALENRIKHNAQAIAKAFEQGNHRAVFMYI